MEAIEDDGPISCASYMAHYMEPSLRDMQVYIYGKLGITGSNARQIHLEEQLHFRVKGGKEVILTRKDSMEFLNSHHASILKSVLDPNTDVLKSVLDLIAEKQARIEESATIVIQSYARRYLVWKRSFEPGTGSRYLTAKRKFEHECSRFD